MVTKIDLRTNDTKKRIIKEAQHLYQMGGYNYLSMDKIAELLSLKRPTLYYHFPGGKEQLLVETIKTITNALVAAWTSAGEAGHDTRSRLRNILDTVVDYPMPENKRTLLIELWQLSQEVKTAIQQSYEQVYKLLSQVFQEGMEKGEIIEVEVELAIHSFMALYDQIENLIAARENFPELSPFVNRFELEVLTDKLFELWMGGMAVQSSSNP
jgi:TetR/AcrR family transcriptional regulator, cholesterol catabolism regulator